ncbi:hypothetical protein D9611_006354 [Ephemerocybe angulata]|uniref:RBR-type E3 ubiquitin transferase n=1 Tax=Ephemerocybe angulata TaxID=980116 RepID=A0A8H5C7J6_9AGAR|nr:hypothetical protein D9611_006354 [Tulosesus angulatus]
MQVKVAIQDDSDEAWDTVTSIDAAVDLSDNEAADWAMVSSNSQSDTEDQDSAQEQHILRGGSACRACRNGMGGDDDGASLCCFAALRWTQALFSLDKEETEPAKLWVKIHELFSEGSTLEDSLAATASPSLEGQCRAPLGSLPLSKFMRNSAFQTSFMSANAPTDVLPLKDQLLRIFEGEQYPARGPAATIFTARREAKGNGSRRCIVSFRLQSTSPAPSRTFALVDCSSDEPYTGQVEVRFMESVIEVCRHVSNAFTKGGWEAEGAFTFFNWDTVGEHQFEATPSGLSEETSGNGDTVLPETGANLLDEDTLERAHPIDQVLVQQIQTVEDNSVSTDHDLHAPPPPYELEASSHSLLPTEDDIRVYLDDMFASGELQSKPGDINAKETHAPELDQRQNPTPFQATGSGSSQNPKAFSSIEITKFEGNDTAFKGKQPERRKSKKKKLAGMNPATRAEASSTSGPTPLQEIDVALKKESNARIGHSEESSPSLQSQASSSSRAHSPPPKAKPARKLPAGDISWMLSLQQATINHKEPAPKKVASLAKPRISEKEDREESSSAHSLHQVRKEDPPPSPSAPHSLRRDARSFVPEGRKSGPSTHVKAKSPQGKSPQFFDSDQLDLLFPSNKPKGRPSNLPLRDGDGNADTNPETSFQRRDSGVSVLSLVASAEKRFPEVAASLPGSEVGLDEEEEIPRGSYKGKERQKTEAPGYTFQHHREQTDRLQPSSERSRAGCSRRTPRNAGPWSPMMLRPELQVTDTSPSFSDISFAQQENSSSGSVKPKPKPRSKKEQGQSYNASRAEMAWQLALVSKVLTPSADYLKEREAVFIQSNPRYKPEKFECLICFETVQGVDGSRLMNCEHSFCQDCMTGHVLSQIQQQIYPILCPVCFADPDRAQTRGFVDDVVLHGLNLSSKDLEKFEDLQMAAIIVKIDCPGCKGKLIVDREDYLQEPFIRCTLDGCSSRFCRACLMVVDGPDEKHACKIDEELDALMKVNGWRYCPGCRTPIQKDSGCNHMTCRTPGCTTHFCYVCGDLIWNGQTIKSLSNCLSAHWAHCQQFDPDPPAAPVAAAAAEGAEPRALRARRAECAIQ